MLVTLINPPQYWTKGQITAGVVPPLGLMYIYSFLSQHNIKVNMIDGLGDNYKQYTKYDGYYLRGLTFENIINRIDSNSEMIGISAHYSFSHLIIKELILKIKEQFPTKKIVLGGAHPTVLTEFVLQDTAADYIAIGEGEETLLDLCRKFNHPEDIKGLAYKKDGKIIINPQRDLISNLDELPLADRDCISMENYFNANEPHGCSKTGKWTTILSSRGCPFKCTFCSTPLLWRGCWRYRSPQDTVNEMIILNKKYGVNDFHFEDENMGMHKKWMHEFTDLLLKGNYGFTWQPSNGLRAESLDYELLVKMKKSGCSLIVITLESANERVRNEIINKKLKIKSVEDAIYAAKQAKLKTTCYFMIGLPGEKIEEAEETIKCVRKFSRIGLDECVIGIFSLLPGTELFFKLEKEDKVKLNEDYFKGLLSMGDLDAGQSWTDFITDKELKSIRRKGYLSFALYRLFFHPLKTIKSILNILSGKVELKSERVFNTFIRRLLKIN